MNKDHPEFEQKMIDFLNDKLKNPNICLNFIDYVSSEDKDDEVVSEDLRYDFYRFLYDNYRKCNVLEQLIMMANGERISGKLCSEKTGIMPDGKYYNICTLSSINNLYGYIISFGVITSPVEISILIGVIILPHNESI